MEADVAFDMWRSGGCAMVSITFLPVAARAEEEECEFNGKLLTLSP